jgi:two-component system NtrC family sensor kinase
VGEGTGLGLSMVYGIIKKHSGKIMVESKVGQGTCFILRLPINETRSLNLPDAAGF